MPLGSAAGGATFVYGDVTIVHALRLAFASVASLPSGLMTSTLQVSVTVLPKVGLMVIDVVENAL